MKKIICLLIISLMILTVAGEGFAGNSSSNVLRQGLLGAGAGAVGGAASGAKGGDLWKGALAGAGVNIVGGALLDSISGEKVADTQQVDNMSSQSAYSEGYETGYGNSYKKGYSEGYKEGLQESQRGQ
ncbi:hypothetical protein ACFL4E_02500 [Candidatus Omnitrophota bacterium]